MELIIKNSYLTDIKMVKRAILDKRIESLICYVDMINKDINDFNTLVKKIIKSPPKIKSIPFSTKESPFEIFKNCAMRVKYLPP